MNKEKLFRGFQNFFEWSDRVVIAGDRLMDFSADYKNMVFGNLDDPSLNTLDPEQLGVLNRKLNAEVYFFSISFHNYIKSMDAIGVDIPLERYKNTKYLIHALRNILEHWESHDFNDYLKGELKKISMKNYKAFLKKFPNSPGTPYGITFSEKGEVTIASILSVIDALNVVEANRILAQTKFNELFS